MKKIIFIYLMCCMNLDSALPKKPWLAFFYLAGHNDLWGFLKNSGLNSLPEGVNKNVNVLSSYFGFANCPDICSDYTTQRFNATQETNKQIGPTKENQNSGDVNILIDELDFAIDQAPSNFFLLFLAGHGQGPANGLCVDFQGGTLTDIEIQNALKEVKQMRGGKKTDVLALDCCYMASLEYYFAWAELTNFIVGSEAVDPGNGIPYAKSLEILSKTTDKKKLAIGIVEAFNDTYINDQGQQQFTLAAVDSSKIKALCNNANSVATEFLKLFSSSNKQNARDAITQALASPVTTFNNLQVDLKDFFTKILKFLPKSSAFNKLKSLLKQGISLVEQAVIKNATKTPGANGITIFTPIFPGKFCCKQEYIDTLFIKTFPNWKNFLDAYIAG